MFNSIPFPPLPRITALGRIPPIPLHYLTPPNLLPMHSI
jgi:hypothetical protein